MQAVLSTKILQEVASILSNPDTDIPGVVQSWGISVLDLVAKLLSHPPPPNVPDHADLFLVQSLYPDTQMIKVLKSHELLQKLNLSKWLISDGIPKSQHGVAQMI